MARAAHGDPPGGEKDVWPLGLVSEPCRGRRSFKTSWFLAEGPGQDLKRCGTAWVSSSVVNVLNVEAAPGPIGSHGFSSASA